MAENTKNKNSFSVKKNMKDSGNDEAIQNGNSESLSHAEVGTKSLKGLSLILNDKTVYSERLPILDVVFDRLVRLLATTLRNFTSDNVEISCSRITSTRFSDYLNSVPVPTLMGVFKAQQWDTPGLITIDSQLAQSIIDVLLGGKKNMHVSTNRMEGRTYTTLERNLVEKLIKIILTDFAAAFSPICTIDFQHERLETNPRFAAVVHEKNVAMKITLKLEMEDRGGHFDIVLPYSGFEPIRDLLVQNFMGEKFGRDHIWEDHLATKIRETDIKLEAELPVEEVSLKEVLEWKVGTQIILSSTMESFIHLCSQDYQLFSGKMGQKNGHIAIKIENILFDEDGGKQ